jgi:hypothetical protein
MLQIAGRAFRPELCYTFQALGERMNVISPKKAEAKISVEEMERRREAVRQADASNRIEGIFPNPKSTAIYEEFIRGEIEIQDIWPRIEALKLRS